MTSMQSASCRLVEFELWLTDLAFFPSSTLLAGMLPLPFPLKGLGTKLQSGMGSEL